MWPERCRAELHSIDFKAAFGCGSIAGLRLDEIPRLDLDRVLDEWPRCGFKTEFPACLARQVALKPESHIAGAMGLGLGSRTRAAPFAE